MLQFNVKRMKKIKNKNLTQLVPAQTHFSEFIDYEMSRAIAHKPPDYPESRVSVQLRWKLLSL